MDLFKFFRRKKDTNANVENKSALADGKLASPKLAALIPSLEPYALPCVRISASPSNELALTDNKFGGYPYWPIGRPYPVDREGRYLYLLAQIDLSTMPALPDYPSQGLLQFYLSADDIYGLDLDHPTRQDNFRVVYFEDTSAPAVDDFSFLDNQPRDSHFPIEKAMALQFTADKDYYGYSDFQSGEVAAEQMMPDVEPGDEFNKIEEELLKLYPDTGHKIGGYAYFTQYDPRGEGEYEDHTLLLLQVDSQHQGISWGDFGVGNFFIRPRDLKRKDFSNVLYNWDCT